MPARMAWAKGPAMRPNPQRTCMGQLLATSAHCSGGKKGLHAICQLFLAVKKS